MGGRRRRMFVGMLATARRVSSPRAAVITRTHFARMSVSAADRGGSPVLPKSVSASLESKAGPTLSDLPASPSPSVTDAHNRPFRFKLRKGEAEQLHLSPAMRRIVDLVNASQAEINDVKLRETLAEYQRHKTDTGSPEVQVALLTTRIGRLAAHLKDNHKDKHSYRGLMGMVQLRRKLMKYLKRTKPEDYYTLIGKLKLRDIKTK